MWDQLLSSVLVWWQRGALARQERVRVGSSISGSSRSPARKKQHNDTYRKRRASKDVHKRRSEAEGPSGRAASTQGREEADEMRLQTNHSDGSGSRCLKSIDQSLSHPRRKNA